MRVLLLWADHTSSNLGVQALARGTEAVVRGTWPGAVVDVENHTPGPWPRFVPAISFARAWAGADAEGRKRLARYDLVIDTASGDSFADIYGMRRLFQMGATRSTAARAGQPVVMGPQTIGPFSSRFAALVARASLKDVKLIMARDPDSAEYCRRVLQRQAVLVSDVVFAMAQPDVPTSRGVVFNVSGLLWSENPHVDHIAYRESTLDYCRRVLDAGLELSLLAHVVSEGKGDADVYAVREVAAAIGGGVEQLVPEDVFQARDFIASGRLTVGARMHACLNSLSVGVPALPWAYSRKFEPLARDLSWPYVLDLRRDHDVAETTWRFTEEMLSSAPLELATVRATADARLQDARRALATVHA